jgi:hypothetical protein
MYAGSEFLWNELEHPPWVTFVLYITVGMVGGGPFLIVLGFLIWVLQQFFDVDEAGHLRWKRPKK